MSGQKESKGERQKNVHSIFMKFRSNGSYRSNIYEKASSIINAPSSPSITTIRTMFGMSPSTTTTTLVTTTGIPPLTTTALDCGYNCSRYIYNQPVTRHSYDILTNSEREMIKEDYYKNYDFMTGLRTAASLGGTILLFSLFILYKMKCRSFGRRKSLATIHENGVTLYDTCGGDVVKEPSFSNGNPGLLTDIKVSGLPVFIHNNAGCVGGVGGVGSRRSSRVILSPEGFSGSPSRNPASGGCCNSGAESASPHESRIIGSGNRLSGLNPPNSPSSLGATAAAIEVLSTSNFSLMSICNKSGLEEEFLPRFRLNSESDSCGFGVSRHSVSKVDSYLTDPIIDIHIIQPTPNVSPCGSMRRLSEDVATFTEKLNHPDPSTVLIPLLSIPKSGRHHTKGKCGANKSKCSKRSSCRTSSSSDIPDTHISCRASTSTKALVSGCPINNTGSTTPPLILDTLNNGHNNSIDDGDDDDNVAATTSQTVDVKFIDCLESDVQSGLNSYFTEKKIVDTINSGGDVDGNIESIVSETDSDTETIQTTSFRLQRDAQMGSRTISETFPEDSNKEEKVSETQL